MAFQPAWNFYVTDLSGNVIVDVSTVASNKKLRFRLNRPATVSFDVPADHSLVKTVWSDGDPYVNAGNRALVCKRDGFMAFNGRLWTTSDSGDANTTRTFVTAFDDLVMLQSRLVRDSTGSVTKPVFASPISGASIIKQMVDNTIARVGPIGITTTGGTFDIPSPPAENLAGELGNWPVTCADLLSRIADTGAVDARLDYIDNQGATRAILSAKNTVNSGRDLSAGFAGGPAVAFEYGTGTRNVQAITRTLDMGTVANNITYYLGPQTGTSYNATLTATNAASQSKYGVFESTTVYDQKADAAIFDTLLAKESLLRKKPRELLSIVPVYDPKVGPSGFPIGTFQPIITYNLGDIVTVNCGTVLRRAFSGQQRIYGFDIDITDDAVETVSQIICSADGE